MPTSLTTNTFYNMVLDIVAERPCAGIADTGRAEVRWLNRNFSIYVQAGLRANLWNFSTELHALSRGTDPDWRWSYSYDLPNGWLRVVPVTSDGRRGGEPVPHEVRRLGGSMVLMTDYLAGDDGLYTEVVVDVQDPGEWDPLFAMYMAGSLAAGFAHSQTHKRSFLDAARQQMADALEQATLANALEGSLEPVEQHDVIRVRSR